MTEITGVSTDPRSLYVDGITQTPTGKTLEADASGTIPQATLGELADALGLPELPAPLRGVSIENLLKAVADEERRQGVQSAVEQIEIKGEMMKAENEKELKAIQDQLAQIKKQETANKFLKAFRIIGAIIGIIASVATIVTGAVTGNPALIGVGIVGLIATGDSIAGLASDGKYTIASGFAKLGEVMGMNKENSKLFGTLMNIALMGVAIAVSVSSAVSAASSAASNIAANATKAMGIMSKVNLGTNIASSTVSVGQQATLIALNVFEYNIANLQADKVDIAAILEQLRASIAVSEELIEAEMETSDKVMSAIKQIIEDCGQTATAIMTAAPQTA